MPSKLKVQLQPKADPPQAEVRAPRHGGEVIEVRRVIRLGVRSDDRTSPSSSTRNMKTFTPEQWYEMGKDLYDCILNEIEHISPEYLANDYSKLVVCYEFFRLIRGEYFQHSHQILVPNYQNDMYQMENEIARRLQPIEKQLDPQDSRTSYYLNLMKKSFSLQYFNH